MPTLDGNTANIIGWAAVIGAVLFLGRTAIAVFRMASKIDELFPVLMQIAKEFKSNGGSTLHDRIVKLETHMLVQDKQLTNILDQLERMRPASRGGE